MIKICPICKINFNVKPSHFDKRICCSKKCQNINQKNKTGELNSNWRGGPKVKKCKNCSKEFIAKNPYAKTIFCSHKCSSIFSIGRKVTLHENTLKYINQKKLDGLKNPKKICSCGNKKDHKSKSCIKCFHKSIKKQKKEIQCKNCNKTFSVEGKYYNKYCSNKCRYEYFRIKYLSDNNPNWKGGVKSTNQIGRNSKIHTEWIKSVFERDRYTCQICHQIGGKLNAHHIYAWAKFKEKRFQLENGITLCVKCHKRVHLEKNEKFIKKD